MPTTSIIDRGVTNRPAHPRVLIIEDNHTQLDLYAMAIEDSADVIKATRGEDGYALACGERPDIILLDVLLPDVDGLALCQRLRMNPVTADIPVLVLTGDDAAYARPARPVGTRWGAAEAVSRRAPIVCHCEGH